MASERPIYVASLQTGLMTQGATALTGPIMHTGGGATSLSGTLAAAGLTTLSAGLAVTGAITHSGGAATSLSGALSVNGAISHTGGAATTLSGTLGVAGIASAARLQCPEQSSAPSTLASNGTFWVQTSGTLVTKPMFTDGVGLTTPVLSVMDDHVSVLHYGADSTGVTDSTAAFTAAAAVSKNLYLPRGTYIVGTVTFARCVRFSPGASMYLLNSGSVWTFNGGIKAGCFRIFWNLPVWTPPAQAPIVVYQTANTEGLVDWFGTDAPAIEACHKTFTITRFQSSDYFVTRTVVFDQSFKQVIGTYGDANGTFGSRIILSGGSVATATIIQVGVATAADNADPGVAIAACARRLEIRGIGTVRAGACGLSTSRFTAAIGWNIQGFYQGYIYNVYDFGSATSFRIRDCVQCTVERLSCVNVTAANTAIGSGGDNYTAFLIGGDSARFGFIGANASLMMLNCACDGGTVTVTGNNFGKRQIGSTGVYTATAGIYLYGYIADTWINQVDLSKMTNGVIVDGNTSGGVAIAAPMAQQDVFLDRIVADTMQSNAMLLINLNAGSMVQVTDPYLSVNTLAAQSPGNGIQVLSCTGTVNINGGVIMSSVAQDQIDAGCITYGVQIQASKNVIVQGALIKDFGFGMFCANSSGVWVSAVINRTFGSGHSAIYLDTMARSYFAPIINASVGKWVRGVFASGNVATNTVTNTEINVTGIQIAALTSGLASDKIVCTDAAWGGGTSFNTTNVVSGVRV